MTLDNEQRNILVEHRKKKAMDALGEARILIDNGMLSIAVTRLYYSMYYMLSALSLKHQFSTKKHAQLIGWFNKNFINTGIIEKQFSVILYSAFDKRQKADYDDFYEFNKDEVVTMFADTECFLDRIIMILS